MIVVVMREEYLNIPEYSDSLEPLMKQLQNEGLWMCIERSVVHKYFCDKHGVIFRYRVLHRHLWEPRDIAIQWITEFVDNETKQHHSARLGFVCIAELREQMYIFIISI